MVLTNAFQSILSILIMVGIGYYLTYKNWFDQEIADLFAQIVVNIALPALMIHKVMTSFSKEYLFQIWDGIFIPLMGVILAYLISIPVSIGLSIKSERRGLFRALFTFSNTIFIGLPVNLALFGEKSTAFVTLYYIAHTTIFWTIGVYGIKKDVGTQEASIFSLATLKRIFSPILGAYVFSLILLLLEVSLPSFVISTVGYLSELTTPLSMFFIGITIYFLDIEKIKINKEMIAILVGRFLVCPLVILFLVNIFSQPQLMQRVFVIEAAMPIMATVAIVSRAYGADHEYATLMIALTTLAIVFVIPGYMIFFTFM